MEDKAHGIHRPPGWQVLFYFFLIAKSFDVGFNLFFLSPWAEVPVDSSKAKKVLIMRRAFLLLVMRLWTNILLFASVDSSLPSSLK